MHCSIDLLANGPVSLLAGHLNMRELEPKSWGQPAPSLAGSVMMMMLQISRFSGRRFMLLVVEVLVAFAVVSIPMECLIQLTPWGLV